MSNLWLYTGFIPLILLMIHDAKNVPYDEIENFYKYALEVKKTKVLYEAQKKTVTETLSQYDSKYYDSIKEDLSKSDKTLLEVVNSIDAELLNLAEKHLII